MLSQLTNMNDLILIIVFSQKEHHKEFGNCAQPLMNMVLLYQELLNGTRNSKPLTKASVKMERESLDLLNVTYQRISSLKVLNSITKIPTLTSRVKHLSEFCL